MANEAARIIIPVETNAAQATRQMRQLEDAVEDTGQDVNRLSRNQQNANREFLNLRNIGAAAIFAGIAAGAARVGEELIRAGSEAEETANRFGVVFQGIQSESNAAARALQDDFGLSSRASQELLANTGDLLTGFGFTRESALELSNEVNRLAVDLASFTNIEGGTTRASQALTAALLGEAEQAKSLGIIINQNSARYRELLAEVTENNDVTEAQAKALVALRIATEQSTNAIGDFERSSDSFANQMRIAEGTTDDLTVALGERLLPLATDIVVAFNEVAGALTDVLVAQNNLRDSLAGDPSADIRRALEEQTRRVQLFRDAINAGGREARGLAAAFGVGVDELDDMLEREEQIRRQLAGRLRAQEEFNARQRASNEQAQARIESEQALQEAEEERDIALQAQEERRLEALESIAEQEEANAEFIAELNARNAEQIAAAEAAQLDGIERVAEAEREAQEERLRQSQFFADSAANIFGNLVQFRLNLDDDLTERQRQNLLILFAFEKAAAIASIGIDTARAIVGFLANPGGPLGVALSIAAGLTGATQAAVVASTPPPFANGTAPMGFRPPAGTSDDTLVAVSSQETIRVTRDNGSQSEGGRAAVILNSRQVGVAMNLLTDNNVFRPNTRALVATR